MIRINNLTLTPIKNEDEKSLYERCLKKGAKLLNIKENIISEVIIRRLSIDARKKNDVFLSLVVDFSLPVEKEQKLIRSNKNVSVASEFEYNPVIGKTFLLNNRPCVIGAGPAGLFLGYLLALNGFNPIIIERGKRVEDRIKDVESFFATGQLDTESNVQFGEGGAGTFSDGKLNTQIKDKSGRIKYVLKTFVEHGADSSILYEQKPHLGTDRLVDIIRSMREAIIKMGGEFLFETKLLDFEHKDGEIKAIRVESKGNVRRIEADNVFLAIGHSARDTFYMLKDKGVALESKSFAVGYRVMHSQELINKSQYGKFFDYFKAAPYKLTSTQNGRGVFSFCNCPGGYVVNASSEEGMLVINGMSNADRGSKTANSAIVIQVNPLDYGSTDDPLAGIEFQRQLEKKAFLLANGKIPVQCFEDYKNNQLVKQSINYEADIKGLYEFCNLRGILNKELEEDFIKAMADYGKRIEGFDDNDVLIAGIESRTSSPVRINRDERLMCNIAGLYPVGEGAGYAGGITSAAVDGIKAFEAFISNNE